jgi:hypothetical protein
VSPGHAVTVGEGPAADARRIGGMRMQQRPFGAILLAALAVLAAVVNFAWALQYFGVIPFVIGNMAFFGQDLIAAILYLIVGIIYLYVAYGLWTLKPWAWLYVVIIAGFNIVLSVLAVIGASTLNAMLAPIVVAGLVLLWAFMPGVRTAFGTAE